MTFSLVVFFKMEMKSTHIMVKLIKGWEYGYYLLKITTLVTLMFLSARR